MGSLRGLHFQPGESKLISVITGSIFDVAVDIRRDSPTFGQWVGQEIGPDEQMWVPDGFAHGFYVTSRECNVVYQTTAIWDKELAGGIAWDDPDIGIEWPDKNPILSEKDKQNQSLKEYEKDLDTRR